MHRAPIKGFSPLNLVRALTVKLWIHFWLDNPIKIDWRCDYKA